MSLTLDQGSEITSRAVEAWEFYRGVEFDFMRPGKPTLNGHIESFNGRLRDECLNAHQFLSVDQASSSKLDGGTAMTTGPTVPSAT